MPTHHTIQQLDHLIISHWEHVHDVDAKLNELLSARKCKINSVFEWTPENIDALLRLNQRLTNCFEKVRDEAKPIIRALQKRLDDNDAFLHDFWIEAKVTPYIYVPDETGTLAEPETGIEMILTESVSEYNVLKIDCINSEEGMDAMAYLNQ